MNQHLYFSSYILCKNVVTNLVKLLLHLENWCIALVLNSKVGYVLSSKVGYVLSSKVGYGIAIHYSLFFFTCHRAAFLSSSCSKFKLLKQLLIFIHAHAHKATWSVKQSLNSNTAKYACTIILLLMHEFNPYAAPESNY